MSIKVVELSTEEARRLLLVAEGHFTEELDGGGGAAASEINPSLPFAD